MRNSIWGGFQGSVTGWVRTGADCLRGYAPSPTNNRPFIDQQSPAFRTPTKKTPGRLDHQRQSAPISRRLADSSCRIRGYGTIQEGHRSLAPPTTCPELLDRYDKMPWYCWTRQSLPSTCANPTQMVRSIAPTQERRRSIGSTVQRLHSIVPNLTGHHTQVELDLGCKCRIPAGTPVSGPRSGGAEANVTHSWRYRCFRLVRVFAPVLHLLAF